MHHTAVLFDLDGVIIDTEWQYSDFWKSIGMADFPNMHDFHERIKGHTLKQIIATYYSENSDRAKEVIDELHDFESKMQFPFIDGVVTFVKALHTEGIPTAIVTSSDQEKMMRLYKQHPNIKELFDHIFTAENTQRSKPAPDCYLHAAQEFGLEAKDCFVFEDSISGLQAGKNSGAIVIGLTTTNAASAIAPLCQCIIQDFKGFSVEQMLNIKRQ